MQSNIKKYSGQAIAIIMVVLIVASVLGASLYSRTLKNKQAASDNKDSIRALEQADSILDLFVRSDYDLLQTVAERMYDEDNDTLIYDSVTGEFMDLLTSAEIDTSIITKVQNSDNPWCEDTSTGSSVKITVSPSSSDDFVTVDVGSARVFNLEGNTYEPEGDCNISLIFNPVSQYALFTIKKIYINADGDIAEYTNDGTTDDMLAYCVGDCDDISSVAAPTGSFINIESGGFVEVTLNETRPDGYSLYQIRVIPLLNQLQVSNELTSCSSYQFQHMMINAAVNCYGSLREKQIFVPGPDSLGYSSLFDYTIYNIGTLGPN